MSIIVPSLFHLGHRAMIDVKSFFSRKQSSQITNIDTNLNTLHKQSTWNGPTPTVPNPATTHIAVPTITTTHIAVPTITTTHIAVPTITTTHIAVPIATTTHIVVPAATTTSQRRRLYVVAGLDPQSAKWRHHNRRPLTNNNRNPHSHTKSLHNPHSHTNPQLHPHNRNNCHHNPHRRTNCQHRPYKFSAPPQSGLFRYSVVACPLIRLPPPLGWSSLVV